MDTVAGPATMQLHHERGEDHSRTALEFIHRLLLLPEQAPAGLAGLLAALAQAFGANGAGVAAPRDGPATVKMHVDAGGQPVARAAYPWEDRPELLAHAGRATTALVVEGPAPTSWLLAAVDTGAEGGWLLWLERGSDHSWSQGETAALPLAGQALHRLVGAGIGAPDLARVLERARVQGALEKASQITGRLAHDFGNVLTGILGFSELSLAQIPANSLPRRYADEVWQSAHQGAIWVQKLQLFSRRRSQAFLPASLPAVVAEEEARVRPVWKSAVALHVALPSELPAVAVDGESLREVLAQLLDNAREAIAGEGVVTLSARLVELTGPDCQELLGNTAPGPHVEITIADSGCGFSPDTRRRLFVDLFLSTKPRHRGLGLAVVYGILQTYRGGLRFGPDPAQGSAVRVYLPQLAAPPTQVVRSSPGPASGARILVVDDDPLTLRFLCSVLESAGYRVQSAAGAAEALALYTSGIDLVLTDIVMPQTNGFELARRLQARNPAVKLFFISSHATGQDWPSEEALRHFDLLAKPFRPEILLRAVRRALEQTRQVPSV
jgi:signal transduction histidine kinase/ActR/RegA family two-component response regulator